MRFARAALGFLLLGVAALGPVEAQQYVISTIAGGGPPATPNWSGGDQAFGMVSDPAGNVYFSSINCVFKLDRNGIITRIAGNSRLGHSGDGGPATNAELSYSGTLALDGTGNLYITDADRVRRVSPSGIITTVAGGGPARFGTGPSEGMPATSIALAIPPVYFGGGIAVDRLGNLFIADTGGVRKVSPSGIITTVASTAHSGALTVDGSGNLFIGPGFLIGEGTRVMKLSPDGVLTTVAGNGVQGFSGDGGPATSAQLNAVFGLAVDDLGNLFIADYNRIRRVSPSGTITTVAGGGSANPANGGTATAADLVYNVFNIALDGVGNLFIADGYAIYKVAPDGNIAQVTSGGNGCCFVGDDGPAVGANLSGPSDVAVDGAGNVFIADAGNGRVRKVSPAGVITTVAGDGNPCFTINANTCGPAVDGIPATAAHLLDPWGVAVDGTGNLFIADAGAHLVRKVSPSGIITTVAGGGSSEEGGPATSARLDDPIRVAVDPSGNLFITDGARIRKVAVDGTIATVAGNGTENFSGDGGPAASAELDPDDSCGEGPGGGLALDGGGGLLIADTYNNAVREISSNGTINTVAGVGHNGFPGDGFSGDGGPATSAHLNLPWGVAFDGAGSFFIADSGNGRIRRVSPNGIIATVADNTTPVFPGDGGIAEGAGLGLTGIAGDGGGSIYFAGNNLVRALRPTSKSVFVEAVVDAASQQANPISPGKIVVIYGAGLGPAQLVQNQAGNGQFGTLIGGTTVSFNGIAAPILYASATQVAAIVPYAVTGMSAQVTVAYQGKTSAAFTVQMALSAPGIFTLNETGAGQAAAINLDGTVNTAANPVTIGGYISLYATGEGQTLPAGADGALGGATPPRPLLPVSVTVGGIPATVQYQGGAPGEVAGLMQVNVQIPSGVQPGGYVPVVLQVGDSSTTPGAVWIAVAGN